MPSPDFKLEFGPVSPEGHCFAEVISDNPNHDGRYFDLKRVGRIRHEDGSWTGVRNTVSEFGLYVDEFEVPTGERPAEDHNKEVKASIAGILSGEVKPDMHKQIKSLRVDRSQGNLSLFIVVKQHPGVQFEVFVREDGSWGQHSTVHDKHSDIFMERASADGWVGWNNQAWDEYVEDQIKIHTADEKGE